MNCAQTIVVVGASLAGLRAAEALRAEGFAGRLVVIGAEEDAFYDRPPLSKQFLAGTWDSERIALRKPEKIQSLGLDLRTGISATRLDVQANAIELEGEEVLGFDGLVIATGAVPRRLSGTDGVSGVHLLRSKADALALRQAIDSVGHPARMVVVGAGFIGSEVAATAHGLGCEVTVLEALPVPLGRVLGEEMGMVCAALHEDHGVEVRTGVSVEAVRPDHARSQLVIELSSAEFLLADVVVVGIGVEPATGWLEGSGLELRNGVVADEALFAGSNVVVAGDVARWRDRRTGEELRVEHWTNAAEQGAVAGRNLLAGRANAEAYEPVPYFWSDQYEVKIQVLGLPRPDDEVVVVPGTGSVQERRFVALFRRDHMLSAVMGFGRPRQLMGYRPLLEKQATFDEAIAHEP